MPGDTTYNQKAYSTQDGKHVAQQDGRFEIHDAARKRGFGALSPRYELSWVAGQSGRPALNAVTDTPASDTYNTAAMTALMIADRDFELLGTNMTTALCTYNAEGGIKLTTAGADADSGILLPNLNANQSAWQTVTWGTDRETEWQCHIKTGSSIANCVIWAGLKLTNTPTTATDADQVFFRYEDDINGGEWQAIASVGDSDSATDTNLAVAANTEYHLVITIDSSRVARFYINGTLYKTSAALTDAIDLIPYIGVKADGAGAAKVLIIYGQAISRAAA